jgi:peptidoglycan pentaglycine glycine transferase (the first glycine)
MVGVFVILPLCYNIKMELKLIHNLSLADWESALASSPLGTEILQSPIWQKVAESELLKTHLLAWEDNGILVALAQILESRNLFGRFWYVPRGPVFFNKPGDDSLNYFLEIKKYLRNKAKEKGIVAIRFEPSNLEVSSLGFTLGKKIKAIQPERTWLLDLKVDDDQLLAQMHQKTRYNIRLAEKRGVLVSRGNLNDLNLFHHLLKETTKRDRFRGHSLEHYHNLLLHSQDKIELWLAKKDGVLLAAGLFSFYGKRATYLHGASADKGREHMAPYLLQWQMIKRAKQLNCHSYDFYGIDEKKWPGVTRFKLGFGGREKKYLGTFILVTDYFRYSLYQLAVYIRHLLKL